MSVLRVSERLTFLAPPRQAPVQAVSLLKLLARLQGTGTARLFDRLVRAEARRLLGKEFSR